MTSSEHVVSGAATLEEAGREADAEIGVADEAGMATTVEEKLPPAELAGGELTAELAGAEAAGALAEGDALPEPA